MSIHRHAAAPEDTFPCPFCGKTARIAVFYLDGEELYQPLCDSCGTPSYFTDDRRRAKDAWAVQIPKGV